MALIKIEDFYPDYRDAFEGNDIKNLSVYAQDDDKVGSVKSVLVDETTGQMRYFIVDTGFWIFGKEVLLPVGLSRVDQLNNRIYVSGLTKEQVESLPKFDDSLRIDYDYEEQVRDVYRPMTTTGTIGTMGMAPGGVMAGEMEGPAPTSYEPPSYQPTDYTAETYQYDHEPNLYNLNEQNHASLKLYEERLIANKSRQKAGEVVIGKHVETQSAQVSVPIEKERVIVERTTPADAGRPVTAADMAFQNQEIAHLEVYEETPDIHKEAFVREEVKVHKEVEQDMVTAQETIRREELDLDAEGRPISDR